jgi:hypothetical protein
MVASVPTHAARPPADFAAFVDQADAEGAVVLHAGGGHVEIALLEDFERLQAAREKHGVERKGESQGFDGGPGRGSGQNRTSPCQRSSPQRCISVCGTPI